MDPTKIAKFKQQALDQGYSPAEVDAFIAEQNASQTNQPVAPTNAPTPQPSFVNRVGHGAIELGKELAQPFVNSGYNILTAGITVPQVLLARIVSEIDPEAADKIYSANILGTMDRAGEIAADPEKAITQQAKDSLNVASYAVPFGKGGNIATKALIPGATVGAMQGLSEDEVTPESVVGNTVLGAAGAGVLHGLTKIPGVLRGGGSKIEKVGTRARTGNVTLRASVGGAAEEKAVTSVLEKYGIKGTPQKRYEMLEPTVEAISQSIDTTLAKGAKPVALTDLESAFNRKVAAAVKQGDVTLPEAQQAFKDYLASVADVDPTLFQNGVSDTRKLFNLKKDVQAATSQVAAAMAKAETRSTLTPTQKIMKSIRDTLDEIITAAHPEVKELTLDQSRLYEAVPSVAAQRKTVPTVRALGITVPKAPVNAAVDVGGAMMEKTGAAVRKVGEALPEKAGQAAYQTATRLPLLSEDNQENNLQNTQSNGSQNYASNNSDQSLTPPLGGQLPPLEGDYITGYSPDQLYTAYQAALRAGDKASASQLKGMYDDELAYQKSNAEPKLTELDKKFAFAGQEAQKALDILENKGIQTGKIPAATSKVAEFFDTQNPDVTAFKSQAAIARTALMNALLGANMSPKEVEKIADFVFDFSQEPTVIRQRMKSFIQSMNDYGTNIAGPDSLPPVEMNPLSY